MKRNKYNLSFHFKKNIAGILFTMPVLLSICIFTIYPVLQSLTLVFYRYNMTVVLDFIGFKNIERMFGYERAVTFGVFGRTFLYTLVSVPMTMILSYLLALLLNRKIKGIYFFRGLFYLVVVIPGIASALIWVNMLDSNWGLFNSWLKTLGLPPLLWLEDPNPLYALLFMNLWGLPGGMILWLAAFRNIPESMYEAADIDGAGKLRKFWNITIPMSTTMVFYNIVMAVIGTLQTFPMVLAKGGDGTDHGLLFITLKIYKEAFEEMNMGYASAIAWVLFLIIALITFIFFKTSKKWVFYGEDNV